MQKTKDIIYTFRKYGNTHIMEGALDEIFDEIFDEDELLNEEDDNIIDVLICENIDIHRTIFIVHLKSLYKLDINIEKSISTKLEEDYSDIRYKDYTYTIFYVKNSKGEEYDTLSKGKKLRNFKIKDFPINEFQQTEEEIKEMIQNMKPNPSMPVLQLYLWACLGYMYYKTQMINNDE